MLSDGDKHWLMVGGSVDRGKAIHSSREALRYFCGQHTTFGSRIEALEELKLERIDRLRLLHVFQLLDDDMRMAFNGTLAIQLLGSREVILSSIDKVSHLHIDNGHLDGERLILLDFIGVSWEYELGSRHLVLGGDSTHGCWIA